MEQIQSQSLKEYVISKIDPQVYYQKRFPDWNSRARPNVTCPFHEDGSHPNLSISLNNGGARCHSSQCGKRIGNIVHFEAELQGISESKAARQLFAEFIRPIIPQSEVETLHNNLIKNKSYVTALRESCSLATSSITKFSLGLDKQNNRITIPIFNFVGVCCNIRNYSLPQYRSNTTIAKIFNRKGYGQLELFPWPQFASYDTKIPLIWMHAEKDTMLAIQLGIQAFCTTGGEDSWMPEILETFSEFEIHICGTNDKSGKQAAEKRLEQLGNLGRTIIKLPTEQKDFADWITYDGGTAEQFQDLISFKSRDKVPDSSFPSVGPALFSQEFQELINVSRNPRFLNRLIRVRAIISGKSDRTFTVPQDFTISTTSGTRTYKVPIGRELLRFIRASDEDIIKSIRSLVRNPKAKVRANTETCVSISELEIIPANSVEQDSPYITQKCFYVGENIETNVPYEMEIMPTTEIRSQETVGIITKAIPINPTTFQFSTSRSILKKLEIFQPDSDTEEDVYDWISRIAIDLSIKYTKIFNRVDWHIVALLSWCCPLQYNFPYEGLQRGWFNSLAIGDTKTGKSEVVYRLRELVGAGAFVNAENCTLVGLLGGAISSPGGGFMLRWGKIPLNNRGLVVVEELSGLSIREISNLSEARSSGKARLDKGGLSSETNAKTRLIFLSNVRGRGKSLSSYISGVRAIEDLIGHAEDISRFDLISTLTVKEVSTDVINSPRSDHIFSLIDLSALRDLIYFIWSLSPDNIHIEKEAYHLCLTKTKELGRIYHPAIPLFDAGSGRLKLSRIAVAIACLCFNWDSESNQIKVETKHIEAATNLLQTLFDKPSCGYREYSEQTYYREHIEGEESLNKEMLESLSPQKRLIIFKYILHATKFTADELSSVGGIQLYPAQKIIGKMVASNLLRKGEANVWELAPVGKHWIEQQMAVSKTEIKSIKIEKKPFTKLWNKL